MSIDKDTGYTGIVPLFSAVITSGLLSIGTALFAISGIVGMAVGYVTGSIAGSKDGGKTRNPLMGVIGGVIGAIIGASVFGITISNAPRPETQAEHIRNNILKSFTDGPRIHATDNGPTVPVFQPDYFTQNRLAETIFIRSSADEKAEPWTSARNGDILLDIKDTGKDMCVVQILYQNVPPTSVLPKNEDVVSGYVACKQLTKYVYGGRFHGQEIPYKMPEQYYRRNIKGLAHAISAHHD